ncbi:site-specific integrase [Actinobacteria bacterium YIM 96077]|uniref:Site-specific integrase n=2 Tax=Phytoactinopolyspora halophila TaxID=1981511 RepID=A0A329QQQ7_9ACTN|nr:site-specific integrase [Actinobacteria bacterium YIM 96077]RAW14700.1 site-specific integrase [Phytoactinopolyspora halophila]
MATVKHDGKRWRARYYDPSGQRREKRFARKVDAQRWLDEQTAQHITGSYVEPKLGKITVAEWGEKWLETKASREETTRARYANALHTHIAPAWSAVTIATVTHDRYQEWISSLSVAGLSPASVEKIHGCFRQMMKYAVRSKRIAANPCEGVTLPTVTPAKKRYLSAEQVDGLTNAVSPVWSVETKRPATPWWLVVFVLAYCGLRWGEMAALHVRDVDMLRRRLFVEWNVVEVDGGKLVWKLPKDHERRWVPFPRFLVDGLTAHIEGKGPDDLLFASPHGAVLRVRNARRSWFDRAVVAAGLPEGFHPNELRHTAASLAVSAGANVKAVQRMLGHAKASMTLDVYADLFDADLEAVADRLDEIATRARGGNLGATDDVAELESRRKGA